jgi:hypothetical protein
MFFDSSEIEYINTHNIMNNYNDYNDYNDKTEKNKNISYMNISKEDESSMNEQELYLFESESMPYVFESETESVPPLFKSELESDYESAQPLFELKPIGLIKQLHIQYDNKKKESVKRYNRGKLHYLTTEEKIIRRREFNRLYAANSRARKQQRLKEQTELKN